MNHPKRYRAKHILVDYLEDAEYILRKIKDGDDFEKLASDMSECESGKNGGDLGLFSSGQMVPEFERALSKMKVGEISTPVKTKFGYHIILRLEV